MKKKLVAMCFAVIMALSCVMGLVACEDEEDPSSVNGEYYVYAGETGDKSLYPEAEIILKDGKVTMIEEYIGITEFTYKVVKGNIAFEPGEGGFQAVMTFEHIDNYYFFDYKNGEINILCKKGEIPNGYTVDSDET